MTELRNLISRMRNPRQWTTTVLASVAAVGHRTSSNEYSDVRAVDQADVLKLQIKSS